MIRAPRWRGWLVLGALIIAIATTIHLLRATPATPKVELDDWGHLSSQAGDLPVPGESDQQTASLVLDIDQDGLSDFVVGAREQAPALVWYQRQAVGWERHVIEPDLLPIEAGGRSMTSIGTAISTSSWVRTTRAITSTGGRIPCLPAILAGPGGAI